MPSSSQPCSSSPISARLAEAESVVLPVPKDRRTARRSRPCLHWRSSASRRSFLRQQIVHHREHALLHLTAIPRAADQLHALSQIKSDEVRNSAPVFPVIFAIEALTTVKSGSKSASSASLGRINMFLTKCACQATSMTKRTFSRVSSLAHRSHQQHRASCR